MNIKCDQYWASFLDKQYISNYAFASVMGTKRQPNFKVDVEDKKYYGWLLTKRECYQTETYGQYEYVRIYIKNLYYFVVN